MRFRLYPTGESWRIELILAIVTGAPKVTPPSRERATTIAAFVEGGAVELNVGPNCHATYSSPFGPITGTELCCNTPAWPQAGLVGSVIKVWSGPATTGPCHVFPPSCVRQTVISPKPPPATLHTSLKFVKETNAVPLPPFAAAIASLS